MDENNRNFILAIVLSIGVLFAWQYFFVPKPHPGARNATGAAQQQTEQGPPQPKGGEATSGGAPQPGAATAATLTREEALAQSPASPSTRRASKARSRSRAAGSTI